MGFIIRPWSIPVRPGSHLIGQSVPQLDIPAKTNGAAKYGIDAVLPGMVYGKPVVPPVRYGAKVTTVDDTDARKVDTSLASCDLQGFPNGRRPGDDVLDITLRVAMGALFDNDAET